MADIKKNVNKNKNTFSIKPLHPPERENNFSGKLPWGGSCLPKKE
jgi:hypothetical protein